MDNKILINEASFSFATKKIYRDMTNRIVSVKGENKSVLSKDWSDETLPVTIFIEQSLSLLSLCSLRANGGHMRKPACKSWNISRLT